MDIDIESAQRHLRLLDPAETSFIFSAFAEASSSAGLPRQLFGAVEDLAATLSVLQANGYGIFVAVNAFHGRRRRKPNLQRVRAIIADLGGPQSLPWPLEPSLRIQTSPGREQVYWLIDPSDPPQAEQAEAMQRSLAARYGADRQATDVTRLLRLAGTWHQKRTPSLVLILDEDGRRYRRGELMRAFPAASPSIVLPKTVMSVGAAVEQAIAELRHASEGTRNGTLNRVAFRLGRIGVDLSRALELLGPTADAIGLRPNETVATIRSGHRAGSAASTGGAAP